MLISPQTQRSDRYYMRQALRQAHQAFELGEVPVGALIVRDDEILSSAHNATVLHSDPSGHAEILAIRKAAKACHSHRLDGATLFVTLEPCLMCCGALLQSRIKRLVFGATESKTGAVISIHESLRIPRLTHHVAVTAGVLADESSVLLQQFFASKRA